MENILDTLKETKDAQKAFVDLNDFIKNNPDALETIIKACLTFLDHFQKGLDGKEVLYVVYREAARAYKKKNLILSNYPYDSQNHVEAAEYYIKAYESAPDEGRKLSSLDGAASMYWNLDKKDKWCKVKLKQADIISNKDKTRLYMDIARETTDDAQQEELYKRALEYVDQMSGDLDVRVEMADRLKRLVK